MSPELDLDDLLANLDEETRLYSENAPAAPLKSPALPRAAPPRRRPLLKQGPPRAIPPADLGPGAPRVELDPSLDDLDREIEAALEAMKSKPPPLLPRPGAEVLPEVLPRVGPTGSELTQSKAAPEIEPVLSEPVLSEPVLSDPVLSEPVLSEPVLSEPVLSEPVLSEPVLSDPVLSDPVLFDSGPEPFEPVRGLPDASPRDDAETARPPETHDGPSDAAVGLRGAPPHSPPGPVPTRADRGAQAARRTVRSRKPRREVFPLLGRQLPALTARAELLEASARAQTVSAPSKARALLAAAELRLQAGELVAVESLVARAYELDASSVAVVRMGRTVAAAKRDSRAVAHWLDHEASLVEADAPGEAGALYAAAADAWARAGDAARAAAAARAAFERSPTLLTSLVALAFAPGEPSVREAYGALRAASAGPLAADIVRNAAACALERGGAAPEDALHEPAVALRALPTLALPERLAAFESLTASLDDDLAEAARLLEISERVAAGETSEALDDAVRRLGREGHRPSLVASSLEAAVRDGSPDEATLSERLAGSTHGEERAALLGRASLLVAISTSALDAEALARASASEAANLGVVSAARARLARLDPARREQRVATDGALAVAAELAREGDAALREAQLFRQAAPDVAARILGIDALGALGGDGRAELLAALHDAVREGAIDTVGGLTVAALAGDTRAAQQLHEAAPSAATARLRVLVQRGSADAAGPWREEASQASGIAAERAWREYARAVAATDVAEATTRLAASDPQDRLAAALSAALSAREGSPVLRAQALARYAETERDSGARARALVRAGLASLGAGDGEQTRGLLVRASAAAPDDPILDLLRWRDATANGVAVPTDVADRRRPAVPDAGSRALATHTSLLIGDTASEARLAGEAAVSVADQVQIEASRRAVRLGESRRAVAAPASLEEAGGDLAALRAMERAAATSLEPAWAQLEPIAFTTAERLDDPVDRAAYLRLAYVVSLRSAPSEANEERFLSLADAASEPDPWLARRVSSLARRRDRPALAQRAGLVVAESFSSPAERASAAVHALPVENLADPRAALEVLEAFCAAAPEHPLVSEHVGLVAGRAGEHQRAAQALEQAARAAASPQRRARLFVAAADAWDETSESEHVVTALEEASKADVTHGQVFERLRDAFERSGETERLSGLVARRLAAGGDDSEAAALYVAQASLREAQNDIEGARQALRSALASTSVEGSPEHLGVLKKLAQLSLAAEDHRGAAEALIRLAKLRHEVEELRWIFFELAGIYDRHIPDVKRAEAAYRRVLKLVPGDAPAMERLAALYGREKMLPQAVEMLEALLKVELDPDRMRQHRLALARIHEQSGDARRSEQTLEATRRASPTDLETLRTLADFYTRQKAQTALAMHLNRAAQDFRHALASDLSDEAAWIGLVEVLGWRGRHDAARATASAAVALGILDVEVAKLVDEHGNAPACQDVVRLPEVVDAIAPAALTSGAREAFVRLGPFLDKVFPLDPRSQRAEKLGPRDPSMVQILADVGQWIGAPELEVWVAPGSSRMLAPIGCQPPAILVGREILGGPDAEQRFLVARAAYVARAGLSGVLRAPTPELDAMLAFVAQQLDSTHKPVGLDPALIQEHGRRLTKLVPRKTLEEVGPLVLEMVGAPEYDAARLPMAVSELGDRVALLVTGAVPPALTSILKLAGLPADATDVSARVAAVRKSPEAASLLTFAVSEACFDARRRSSASR
jgi:hypothetical protein